MTEVTWESKCSYLDANMASGALNALPGSNLVVW